MGDVHEDRDAALRPRAVRFPDGFLWGAATSAHQVEGDNCANDWWLAEQAGRLPFKSADACRHFERYESDFALAESMGHNCHRLSIEWSRIQPAADAWDEAALEHYCGVIDSLRAHGLEPVVTLHHFTNPAWFAARGGWSDAAAPKYFASYVSRVVERLGERVGYWLTINEPMVYVLQGYINGEWPPFERSLRRAVRVVRNLARGHRAAYDAIKAQASEARVSFAHNALHMEPCDAERRRDRVAARCRHWLYNEWFLRLIRASGQPKLDFVALNYYTRCSVRSQGLGSKLLLGTACKEEHHPAQGIRGATGWEVYPRGLGLIAKHFAGLGLPLFITENGFSTDDDEERRAYLGAHLRELAGLVEAGVPVIGYLHWSLFDNFEWAAGILPRFGLAETDFATQERRPRDSARDFERVCRDNQVQM